MKKKCYIIQYSSGIIAVGEAEMVAKIMLY